MITLKCLDESRPDMTFSLLTGQKYEIGRRDADINFPDETSVSKHHAELVVEHPIANVTNPVFEPTVTLTDVGSRFGTFVNVGIEKKIPLPHLEPMSLKPGCTIKFGPKSLLTFTIECKPLVVTYSSIDDDGIEKLEQSICRLGGHVLDDWSDTCEYLVMNSFQLTKKAVLALALAKHIVTVSYFSSLKKAYKKTSNALPKPEFYIPSISEAALISEKASKLFPDTNRRIVFKDKTFLFHTLKEMKMYEQIINTAGGTSKVLNPQMTALVLESPNTVIMTSPESEDANNLSQCIGIYKKAGKRFIEPGEIGLAIFYISTKQHCNPIKDCDRRLQKPETGTSMKRPSSTPPPPTTDFKKKM